MQTKSRLIQRLSLGTVSAMIAVLATAGIAAATSIGTDISTAGLTSTGDINFADTVAGDTISIGDSDDTLTLLGTAVTAAGIANWNTAYGWGDHDGLYATLAGTEIFTNKTLNAPLLKDANGNPMMYFVPDTANNGATADNYLQITNGSSVGAATSVRMATVGAGANIALHVSAKGLGQFILDNGSSNGDQFAFVPNSAGSNRYAGTLTSDDLTIQRTWTLPDVSGDFVMADGSLTSGSLPFAGSGGVLTQDNSNLFWDDTNNRLGIGNVAPVHAVDVAGTVRGRVSVMAKSSGTTGAISMVPGTEAYSGYVEWRQPAADGVSGNRLGYMGWDTADVTMRLEPGNDFIVSGGNFGIGDTTPVALLTVGTNDAFRVDGSGNITTGGTLSVAGINMSAGYMMHKVGTVTAYNGGGQASATAVTGEVININSATQNTDSVKLPAAVDGMVLYLVNRSGYTVDVFSNGTDTLNGSATVALSMPVHGAMTCIATTNTSGAWNCAQ